MQNGVFGVKGNHFKKQSDIKQGQRIFQKVEYQKE